MIRPDKKKTTTTEDHQLLLWNSEYFVNDWPVIHPGLFRSKTKYVDTNSKDTYKNSLRQKLWGGMGTSFRRNDWLMVV